MEHEGIQYILFEGQDLAGKTLAVNNFIDTQTSPWDIRRLSVTGGESIIGRFADNLQEKGVYDNEVLGYLYCAAILADVQNFMWPTNNTIQDSVAILRSMAYFIVNGFERLEQVLADVVQRHPKFTSAFVFTADFQSRMSRLEGRRRKGEVVTHHDELILRDTETFFAMERCLIAIAGKYFDAITVDTSNLTPAEVVVLVQNALREP